jgi:hypothetical protein
MPSPIAVERSGCRFWIVAVTAPIQRRGTTVVAVPAKETSATLNFGGNAVTKSFAAALAASSLVGFTSVAIIDNEMSMVTTIVARSRGTETESFGFANASVNVSRLKIDSTTATCLSQYGPRDDQVEHGLPDLPVAVPLPLDEE